MATTSRQRGWAQRRRAAVLRSPVSQSPPLVKTMPPTQPTSDTARHESSTAYSGQTHICLQPAHPGKDRGSGSGNGECAASRTERHLVGTGNNAPSTPADPNAPNYQRPNRHLTQWGWARHKLSTMRSGRSTRR